jgi:FkbM family methyltransferase
MIAFKAIYQTSKNYIINKPAFYLPENLYVKYIVFISTLISFLSHSKIRTYSKIAAENFPQYFIHKITVGNEQIMFQNGFRISRFIRGFDFAGERMWRRYKIDEILGSDIPEAILDVGANIGEFSYFASIKFSGLPKIISIEPDPVVLKCIEFNLKETEINIEPIAVSNKSAVLKFYLKPTSADSSFHIPSDDAVEIEVAAKTLDSVIEKYSLSGPILVKMDCEGHEPEALEGLMRNKDKIKWISIDSGPERSGVSTTREVISKLRQHGFENITTHGFNIVTAVKQI